MTDTFPYSEKLVAEKLSFQRREVREKRELFLERGVDWEKDAGGAVMLSAVGLAKLFRLLGIDPSIDLPSLEKNGAAESASRLLVVAVCMNPRMVLANESGDPNQERTLVDVGRNKNFAIGDVLEVAEHETQVGMYQLVSKLPATARRPETNQSLRDPGADWGRVEADQIREKGAEFRRKRAAMKR